MKDWDWCNQIGLLARQSCGVGSQRPAEDVPYRAHHSGLARLLRHDPVDADRRKLRFRKQSDQPPVGQLLADDVVWEPRNADAGEDRLSDDHDVVGAQRPVYGDRLTSLGSIKLPHRRTATV